MLDIRNNTLAISCVHQTYRRKWISYLWYVCSAVDRRSRKSGFFRSSSMSCSDPYIMHWPRLKCFEDWSSYSYF